MFIERSEPFVLEVYIRSIVFFQEYESNFLRFWSHENKKYSNLAP